MEVHERIQSQPCRSSIKRPWEEDTTPTERGNTWESASLPLIDAAPYRRISIEQEGYEGRKAPKGNGPDPNESVMKKAKFERHDYNAFSRRNLAPNGRIWSPPIQNSLYTQAQSFVDPPTYMPEIGLPNSNEPPNGRLSRDGLAAIHDSSNLCRRCKSLAIQNQKSTVSDPDSCEDCKRNPELAWLSQECSVMLSNLAETLSSGVSSETRDINRGVDQQYRGSTGCPPIEKIGLKQTLKWVLGRIYHVNQLADQFVRQVLVGSSQERRNASSYSNGKEANIGPADIMNRRIDVDSDDGDSSDAKPHIRRASVTTSKLANEELPTLRSQPDYYPPVPSVDGPIQKALGMDPPPAPNRQLSSPPGRSLPSPTSLSIPSPSIPSYGINTQSISLPPPSSLHTQSSSNYLPPITVTHSPDSALRDHTAALQHEVSIQKIALSSLQGEHDKLLAAFSRSQTRASALEKKHAVSDSEIISLTEEKMRLQGQVIDLERDVEELGRSRDEFRQAAVQEGAQYVEIVQRATRLEEIAGEERKTWCKLREDMERTIATLKAGSSGEKEGMTGTDNVPLISRSDGMDMDIPATAEVSVSEMKTEPTANPRPIASSSTTSDPSVQQESVEDLKAEIHRLQERCQHVESALQSIRDDSRSMEDTVKHLLERADSALQS